MLFMQSCRQNHLLLLSAYCCEFEEATSTKRVRARLRMRRVVYESRYATGSTFVTMVTDHVTSKYRLSRDFLFTFVLVWNLILASFVSARSNEQRDSLVVVIVMLELGMI